MGKVHHYLPADDSLPICNSFDGAPRVVPNHRAFPLLQLARIRSQAITKLENALG
jgi:hypothetical protein